MNIPIHKKSLKPYIFIYQSLAFIVKDEPDDRMTKEFLLHKDKKKESQSHGQAHLVFADTQSQL